tara:strand:- start:428 stop:760 length:333 start_codon:yes stop_codon:yes gene_type:complete
MTEQLKTLCDLATEAHEKVQAKHADIDPIVGVHHKMRDAGFAADVMTIDCLKSGKRIIVILNDEQPDVVNYQFSYKDKDPAPQFEQLAFGDLTVNLLYDWMSQYFARPAH